VTWFSIGVGFEGYGWLGFWTLEPLALALALILCMEAQGMEPDWSVGVEVRRRNGRASTATI
jgi:hypothetical protein